MQNLTLYFSDRDFRIDGIEYRRIPIFVRPASMEIEAWPTEFLIYVALVRGRSRSHKTWRAYAYAILSYIRFMEGVGISWRQPSEERLAHYRANLEKLGLVRPTIARNIRRICFFYEWLFRKGLIATLPFATEDRDIQSYGMTSHIGKKVTAKVPALIPPVPKRRRYPRYFNRIEQENLYALLTERDKLIMEWAIYTGAREFEIAGLRVDQLPPQTAYVHRRTYQLPIVGKGGAVGDLHVPTWLMNRTHQYVKFFGRAENVRKWKKQGYVIPPEIFISRLVTPLQPDSIYRAFKDILKAAELTGTFHAFRHTYAISTLHKLMGTDKNKGTDGLAAIDDLKYLMRHESITSTTRYLEAWRFYETEIYSDLFEIPERYLHA